MKKWLVELARASNCLSKKKNFDYKSLMQLCYRGNSTLQTLKLQLPEREKLKAHQSYTKLDRKITKQLKKELRSDTERKIRVHLVQSIKILGNFRD